MAAICYQQLLIREAEEKAEKKGRRSENLWGSISNPRPCEEKGFAAIPAKNEGGRENRLP